MDIIYCTNWKFVVQFTPHGCENRPRNTAEMINQTGVIVKFRINWALSNSLNAYDRHSDWHKLEVYATKMSTYC